MRSHCGAAKCPLTASKHRLVASGASRATRDAATRLARTASSSPTSLNARAARSIAGNPPPFDSAAAHDVAGSAAWPLSVRRYASVSARDGSSRGARRVPFGPPPTPLGARRRRPRRALDASRDPPGTSTRRDGRRPGIWWRCTRSRRLGLDRGVRGVDPTRPPRGRTRARHPRIGERRPRRPGRDRACGTPPRDETTRPGSRARRRGPRGARRRARGDGARAGSIPGGGTRRGVSRLSPQGTFAVVGGSDQVRDARVRGGGVGGVRGGGGGGGALAERGLLVLEVADGVDGGANRANAGGEDGVGGGERRRRLGPRRGVGTPSRTRRGRRRGDGGRGETRRGGNAPWASLVARRRTRRRRRGRPRGDPRGGARRNDCCAPRRVASGDDPRRRPRRVGREWRGTRGGFAARAKHEAASRASPDRNAAAPAALAAVHVSCADGATGAGGGAGVVSERSIAAGAIARLVRSSARNTSSSVMDSEKWSASAPFRRCQPYIAPSRGVVWRPRDAVANVVTPPGRRFDSPKQESPNAAHFPHRPENFLRRATRANVASTTRADLTNAGARGARDVTPRRARSTEISLAAVPSTVPGPSPRARWSPSD